MTVPIGFKWAARPVEPYREIRFIRQFVDDFNTTCIQAGGHNGDWAVEYARYFNTVLTCEPNPHLFPVLKDKALTLCENVYPIQVALGETIDTVALTIPRGRAKCGYVDNKNNSIGIPVPQTTLDDVGFRRYKTGLIHLDIEGAELPALKGAYKIIQRDRPIIVVEDHTLDHMQYTEEELDGWLDEQGYTLASVGHYQRVYTP